MPRILDSLYPEFSAGSPATQYPGEDTADQEVTTTGARAMMLRIVSVTAFILVLIGCAGRNNYPIVASGARSEISVRAAEPLPKPVSLQTEQLPDNIRWFNATPKDLSEELKPSANLILESEEAAGLFKREVAKKGADGGFEVPALKSGPTMFYIFVRDDGPDSIKRLSYCGSLEVRQQGKLVDEANIKVQAVDYGFQKTVCRYSVTVPNC